MKIMCSWNDDWRSELERIDSDCYDRLCECKNSKSDILKIAKSMYKYNPTRTKAECLDRTIEWVSDWNNQPELDLDDDTFDAYILRM